MARAIITTKAERSRHEPLYDTDPRTGATIEVFYGDAVLARSFGARGPGWFCWSCAAGRVPMAPPLGPFATSYAAYRQAMAGPMGLCANLSSVAQTAKA